MVFAERVVAAWVGVPTPAETAITDHHCEECDEIAAYFGGKPWRDLTNLSDLAYHADALFLFSNVAFHYYLPAYMLATLKNPEEMGLAPDNIASSFKGEFGAASRDRLALFDSVQRALVGEFLEVLLRELCEEDQNQIRIVSVLLRGG